jgi:fructosamine-3-kinase
MSWPARSHPFGARHLSLPERALEELAAALGSRAASVTPVTGGCISPVYHVRLADDTEVCVKTVPERAPPGLLAAEADSLRALALAGTVRVPVVLALGDTWLALEWLRPAAASRTGWAELGRGLARLHRQRGESYGWPDDNFIGTLPQAGQPSQSWPDFWAEKRLRPQLDRARRYLTPVDADGFGELLDLLPELIGGAPENEGPSLLHGDLWSGNVHMSEAGPAVIDPACWYGHREVDLAMAALFGGFPAAFRQGYADEWPLLPGVAARQPIYQLYYLLVHVNLFGRGYMAQTRETLHAALGR